MIEESSFGKLSWIQRCFRWRWDKFLLAFLRSETEGLFKSRRLDYLCYRLNFGWSWWFWLLRLALRIEMHLRIGFDWCGWVQCPIVFFNASLGTARLSDLMLIVFEAEKVWHVVCAHVFFASTAWSQLSMHHWLSLEIVPHFGTLHVNWFRYAIVLIICRQIDLNTISCLDIDFEYLFSFKFRSRRLNERSLFWSLTDKCIIILTRLSSHRAIVISSRIGCVLSVETSQAAGHGHGCLVNRHGLLSMQMV